MKLEAINHRYQWFGGHSYAQHGDDFVVVNIFKRLGIERPSYIDIGAHHPYELSNTALLYERGSSGVNVDANAEIIPLFNQERLRDVNVWAAILHPRSIGDEPYTTLHRLSETSGLNTTVYGLVGARDAVRVPAHTISYIVHNYANNRWPDFLTIDAEGRDLEILESIAWNDLQMSQLPKVICVEAVSPNGDISTDLRHLLNLKGYYVHTWCGGNMIFVHSQFKYLLH